MKSKLFRCRRAPSPASQAGVSLIEVMVSVLVLGVALLGIAAMQATALRNGQSSLERSQIVAYTYSAIDAMRANRQEALAGAYNTDGMECSVPGGGSLAQDDVSRWMTSLKNGIAKNPDDESVCGQITCAAEVCTVTVQWDDTRGKQGDAAADNADNVEGGAQRQVQTAVRL
ncbi:prepilin-type N-terminal cleavage/methylation domain-containing protein [Stenotrophomonas sp.]|uniref:prepilin-type N-terminal cleavage/methylation domain-containing protein n=1 Tax=Stenotrophomonas sp. TaxID=69392 RepID=UPI00289A1F3D|nr:prepilin-type N-terminal cleavage/methylation domain-containing protein [Stenotrophomonas sp.]